MLAKNVSISLIKLLIIHPRAEREKANIMIKHYCNRLLN